VLTASWIINSIHSWGAAVSGMIVGAGLGLVVPPSGMILADLGLGMVGLAASLNTLTTLAAVPAIPRGLAAWFGIPPAACGINNPTVQILAVLTVAGVFLLTGAIVVLTGLIQFRAGLALYGSLDLLMLLARSPGTPIADNGRVVIAALTMAVVLGLVITRLPDLTCAVVGIAVGAVALLTATLVANSCTTNASQLTATTVTVATWTITRRHRRARA
jgi:hypothetical protein